MAHQTRLFCRTTIKSQKAVTNHLGICQAPLSNTGKRFFSWTTTLKCQEVIFSPKTLYSTLKIWFASKFLTVILSVISSSLFHFQRAGAPALQTPEKFLKWWIRSQASDQQAWDMGSKWILLLQAAIQAVCWLSQAANKMHTYLPKQMQIVILRCMKAVTQS